MNSNGPKHAKFIDFYFEIHLLETDVQKQKQAFSIFDLKPSYPDFYRKKV